MDRITQAVEKCEKYRKSGYACSESVFRALADIYHLKLSLDAYRIISVFAGGGVDDGRCGVLEAGLFVIAILYKEEKLIDMYPEYIGTALTDIIGAELETDVDAMFETVSKEFSEQWKIKWLELTTMEDKVVMVMRSDRAKELGVKTLTDLQKVSDQLILGDGVNFAEREDDLLRLNSIFGEFAFKVENVDYSLAYPCLEDRTVDVIPGLSTDPQLLGDTFVVIEEDKPVWPAQYVAPIVRQEVLDKNPDIENICNDVSKNISTDAMIKMLDQVVNGGEEYEDVAKEFYEENCK